MKQVMIIALLTLTAVPAHAACTAEYKAKQNNPLKLEHGYMSVPDDKCSVSAAQSHVAGVLASRGWELLNIVSVSKN